MARVRSPNYPSVSLIKAIELADKIYRKEHTHKAAPDVVAKAIGYSGLNGAALGALSALKKFGLLEEIGKDLKISSDALTILVDPKDSKERAAAIKKCAFLPPLFLELQKQYGDTLPSDENMRSFLLKRGFSISAVDLPIRSYRETLSLVSELPMVDNDSLKLDEQEEGNMQTIQGIETPVKTIQTGGAQAPASDLAASLSAGSRRDIFSLDEGDVVLQWPENMSAESFEDFESWIELQLRKIKRTIN